MASPARAPEGPTFYGPELGEVFLTTRAEYLRRRAADVGYSAQVLFQALQCRQYAGSYETVKRFVRPLRETLMHAAVTRTRSETLPGLQSKLIGARRAAHSYTSGEYRLRPPRKWSLRETRYGSYQCENIAVQLSQMIVGHIQNRLIHEGVQVDVLRCHQGYTPQNPNCGVVLWEQLSVFS